MMGLEGKALIPGHALNGCWEPQQGTEVPLNGEKGSKPAPGPCMGSTARPGMGGDAQGQPPSAFTLKDSFFIETGI